MASAFLSSVAAAQTITDPTAPPAAPSPTRAAERPPSPFSFTGLYTADLLDDIAGGLARGGGYVHLIKVSAAYDGAQAGREGLTGLVSLADVSGGDFTATRVGGVQAVSASEAQPAALRLYEAWLQRAFDADRAAVKAGLIDINTTFDVQETAALFLNASHGIGPDISDTGIDGPSDYPIPALALTGVWRPAEGWTAQLGVFDGVAGDPAHRAAFVAVKFDGALIIGQVERRFGDIARLEAGAWTYTSAFPSLDQIGPTGEPASVHGNAGVYALAEGRLMAAPGEREGGLNGWVRVGLANGDINEVADYLGAGLVYTGLIHGREKDEIGLAVARAGFGAGARCQAARQEVALASAETDIEATYRFVAKDWLNIQPDVQYVIDPHGDPRLGAALVVGVRLAFTYSK